LVTSSNKSYITLTTDSWRRRLLLKESTGWCEVEGRLKNIGPKRSCVFGGEEEREGEISMPRILTGTSDSSIFTVDTVVGADGVGETVNKPGFCTTTINIVQPDPTNSSTKKCSGDG
jgi:hypothetical protein